MTIVNVFRLIKKIFVKIKIAKIIIVNFVVLKKTIFLPKIK